ncbi:ABC transporter substrate-binding protein [Zooshikella harenae]|uniref:ABC transporter substrate-binding protein n=1 Tax=Zooshikella harenae TaxID=2827238 RepID=A0ABS5ZJ65_9GAMM|nr:helical backbone metal receptor [Zooshikella harenae]MBU2713838.1 ABC transporter substrate-binding protein [Zooshikella harenae]
MTGRSVLRLFFSILVWGMTSLYCHVLAEQLSGIKKTEKNIPRVVSLAPHITELLYAVGAGENIVGVIDGSDFPLDAQKKTIIGHYNLLNWEQVFAVQPQLIIAWGSGNKHLLGGKAEQLGIPIIYSEPKTLQDIADELIRFGNITAHKVEAEQAASDFKQHWQRLASQVKKQSLKQKVAILLNINPIQTLNGRHLTSEIIEQCGGKNIFANAKVIAPQVNFEALLAQQPDWLIMIDPVFLEQLTERWQALKAVQQKRIIIVNPDHFLRQTPRILLAMETICQKLASTATAVRDK